MELVTGVTGQDGGYLAELLLGAGHRVGALIKPGEVLPDWAQAMQHAGLSLFACDLADPPAFRHLLRELHPERVYHCAAVSVPSEAAADPRSSQLINVTSVEVLSDWLRRDAPAARVLVVSSSAIFGANPPAPQDEATPMDPAGEYARQKAQVRGIAAEARRRGLYCACAIPFNHESPRRTDSFVLPKVCRAAVRISRGEQQTLQLGDLRPRRDWGYAPEFAQAMQWMLEVPEPLELVLATGEAHSVGELVELAFGRLGLSTKGCILSDSQLLRPDDQALSIGKAERAYLELGWAATTKFEALVELMLAAMQAQPA